MNKSINLEFQNDIKIINNIKKSNNNYFDDLIDNINLKRNELNKEIDIYFDCLKNINYRINNIYENEDKLKMIYDYKVIMNSIKEINLNKTCVKEYKLKDYKSIEKIKKSVDILRKQEKGNIFIKSKINNLIENKNNFQKKIEINTNLEYWKKLYKKNNLIRNSYNKTEE